MSGRSRHAGAWVSLISPGSARAGRLRDVLAGWPGALALITSGLVAGGLVWGGLADQVAMNAAGPVLGVTAVAAVGIVAGVAGRPRRWWLTWGAGIAVAATVVVAAAHWWLSASGLVADHYPPSFLVWTWLGVWAVGVGVTGWWTGARAIRVVRALAAPVALASAFLLINSHYGYWPTVGALLDRPVEGQVTARRVYQEIRLHSLATGLVRSDKEISVLRTGLYGPISIPGDPDPFAADSAWVWLPPAYFQAPPRDLPVLLMLTGLPGSAQDWVTAGQVVPLADAWARDHGGAAPVMIFVDENGRGGRDTECVNGPQGAAESYLADDVPIWVDQTLGVGLDPARWGVVGFSEGGTCAIGLAIENPAVFGSFVDVAGDPAPSHGGPEATLRYLYGGNPVAARGFDPGQILTGRHFQHLEGWFAAGTGDRAGLSAARYLAVLAGRAGIGVHTYQGPGGHTWAFARQSFARIYPSLVRDISGQDTNPVRRPGEDFRSRSIA